MPKKPGQTATAQQATQECYSCRINSVTSAAVRGATDGVSDMAQLPSASTISKGWGNFRGLMTDIVGMAKGDKDAIKSFNASAYNSSIAISKPIIEPVKFLSTMPERSLEENVYGLSYYGAQFGINYLAEKFLSTLSSEPRIIASNTSRTFNHFTNKEGVTGITGINANLLDNLKVGSSLTVNELSFGTGTNTYLQRNAGDIFVTDFGLNTTPGKLEQMGVFGDKQKFVISFLEEDAFNQGVRVKGSIPERGIYTIPANTTLKGAFKITKTR